MQRGVFVHSHPKSHLKPHRNSPINLPKTIGHEIKCLANMIKRCFDENIKNSELEGLTAMQGWILAYLYHHGRGQEIFQRDLEREFDIRRSTVTGMLQLMEGNGLITREPVAHDGRLKRLRLTPRAISHHEAVIQKFREMENQLGTGLTEDEIATFFYVVEKIKANIE